MLSCTTVTIASVIAVLNAKDEGKPSSLYLSILSWYFQYPETIPVNIEVSIAIGPNGAASFASDPIWFITILEANLTILFSKSFKSKSAKSSPSNMSTTEGIIFPAKHTAAAAKGRSSSLLPLNLDTVSVNVFTFETSWKTSFAKSADVFFWSAVFVSLFAMSLTRLRAASAISRPLATTLNHLSTSGTFCFPKFFNL